MAHASALMANLILIKIVYLALVIVYNVIILGLVIYASLDILEINVNLVIKIIIKYQERFLLDAKKSPVEILNSKIQKNVMMEILIQMMDVLHNANFKMAILV